MNEKFSPPHEGPSTNSVARMQFPIWGTENGTALALFALTIALIIGSRVISPGFGGWEQAQAILLL